MARKVMWLRNGVFLCATVARTKQRTNEIAERESAFRLNSSDWIAMMETLRERLEHLETANPDVFRQLLLDELQNQQDKARKKQKDQEVAECTRDIADDPIFAAVKAAQKKGKPAVCSGALWPRSFVERSYMVWYQSETAKQNAVGQFQVNKTFGAAFTHSSIPPIHSLKPITLAKVAKRVNDIHRDKVLFVRTVAPAFKINATNLLVDDGSDVILLSVYNFVDEKQDPQKVFPVGTHIAVLQPYMKHARDDPKEVRAFLIQCVCLFVAVVVWLCFEVLR